MDALHAPDSTLPPISDLPRGTRALVVEDEKCERHALRLRLQSLGLEVFVARNIDRAGRVLQEVPIDLLILDTLCPEDGQRLEWARSVRTQHPDIVLIVIAGQNTGRLEQRCDALGAAAYLVKPVSFRTLRRCIQRAFTCRRHLEEVRRLQRQLDTARAADAGPNSTGEAGHEPEHRVDDLWFAIFELLLSGAGGRA